MANKTDPASFLGADEFLNAILAVLEVVSGNQKVLLNFPSPIIKYVLPVLLNKLKSDGQDLKFLCLKIFADIVMQYLADERTRESERRSVPLYDLL